MPKCAKKGPRNGLITHGVAGYRVVDMEGFLRLQTAKTSIVRTARALGLPECTVRKLREGKHWQQSAEKVRKFNELRGVEIDEASGIPPEEVLQQYGSRVRKRQLDAAERAKPAVVPDVLDTKYFVSEADRVLALLFSKLDDHKLDTASPRDLISGVSVMTEKRNLLRGEPTQIITHEQRKELDKLTPLLLEEAVRRGLHIPEELRRRVEEVPVIDAECEQVEER